MLQQTSLVLWQKWGEFDRERGFLPWARGIALNEIRNFLRRSERKNVHLSESVVCSLAAHVERDPDGDRMEALEHCLGRLEQDQRDLLEQCYLESMGVKVVAESLGVTRDAIYMRLHRIRRDLVDCITRRMTREIA